MIAAIASSAGECSVAICTISPRAASIRAGSEPAIPIAPTVPSSATTGTRSTVENRLVTSVSSFHNSGVVLRVVGVSISLRDATVPSPSRRSRNEGRSGRRHHSIGCRLMAACRVSSDDGCSWRRPCCSRSIACCIW